MQAGCLFSVRNGVCACRENRLANVQECCFVGLSYFAAPSGIPSDPFSLSFPTASVRMGKLDPMGSSVPRLQSPTWHSGGARGIYVPVSQCVVWLSFWKATTRVWRSSSPCADRSASTWWGCTPQPCWLWCSPGCLSGSTRTQVLPGSLWVRCCLLLSHGRDSLNVPITNQTVSFFETVSFVINFISFLGFLQNLRSN